MYRYETVVGVWSELVDRLERSRTFERWQAIEPALANIVGVDRLPIVVEHSADCRAADDVFGALVRLAARGESDASLVVVHLLRAGVEGLARRFRHRGPDVLALVVGELVCQIRVFPWRTSKPYPARLLLDTKHALWNGELRPILDRRRPHEAFPIDPLQWHLYVSPEEQTGDVDLVDLFSWAAGSGVVSVDDLRLLVALEEHRGYGNQARQRVADEWGVNERTVRRRRDRALAALRSAVGDYLSAVA